jgi:3-oxoacyl-[acyl-carrier protein] reductase
MNIIITGASTGIGYHAALEFARHSGFHVLAIARSEQKLKKLQKEANESEGKISIMAYDIRSRNENSVVAHCNSIGMERVDILINNAGLLINKPFETLGWDDWTAIYETNVIGLARFTSVLLPLMGGDKRSHILNISSMGGVPNTSKFPGLSAYSSSKGAVSIFSECLAEELKLRNIAVNALALGAVQTDMLQKAFPDYRAKVTPQEFAKYLFWFSTSGNRFVNGKVIPVGGVSL